MDRPERSCQPTWNLIGRVLAPVQHQQASTVLVAPIWRGQPWFPVLLGMLIDYPRWIPSGTELAFNLNPILSMPHLAVLHISGRDKEISIFQTMLLNFLTDGEQKQTIHMTHCVGDSIAGVLKEALF